MDNNMDNELRSEADLDREILARLSQLFDRQAHPQSPRPVLQETVEIMIPEIYPWLVNATFVTNSSRYVIRNEDTGETFIIMITAPNNPILGDVAGYVWLSFEAIHLPYHPHLVRTYIEMVDVPYFDAQEFPRWIFGDLGIRVEDFLEAFHAGYNPHIPLHARLGLPPFAAVNPASLPAALPAFHPGVHTLLPAAQPALPFAPYAPLLAAPPAPPAALAAPLQPPPAGNIRIAYEDLDLPVIAIRRRKRKANPSCVRRMTVPLRLWEGFKQWMQAERDTQVRANAVNREMRQDHLDGYLRFYLEEQDIEVPADARPTEGYHVTRNFEYVQEGEEEEEEG